MCQQEGTLVGLFLLQSHLSWLGCINICFLILLEFPDPPSSQESSPLLGLPSMLDFVPSLQGAFGLVPTPWPDFPASLLKPQIPISLP